MAARSTTSAPRSSCSAAISDTAFLQSAPASSDISVWQFLMPVLTGGRTVIADTATVCDGAELLRLIRAERISLIELVPVVLKELLDAAAAASRPRRGRCRICDARW